MVASPTASPSACHSPTLPSYGVVIHAPLIRLSHGAVASDEVKRIRKMGLYQIKPLTGPIVRIVFENVGLGEVEVQVWAKAPFGVSQRANLLAPRHPIPGPHDGRLQMRKAAPRDGTIGQ